MAAGGFLRLTSFATACGLQAPQTDGATVADVVALVRPAAGTLRPVPMLKGKDAIEFLEGHPVGYIAVDCNGAL